MLLSDAGSTHWPKLIVLTDLHITAGAEIIGIDPSARLRDTLRHAVTAHPDAQAVVLMGDLTHHGRPDQYRALKDILADCPVPIIPTVGNHDRREAFYDVFPAAPRSESGHVQTLLDLADHRIITLDTLDGPPYPAHHHAGHLCDARLAWLDDALDGLEGRIPVVFAHHPPFDTGIIGMDMIKLKNGDALLSRLALHPRAHLLCGHIHRTISGSTNGVAWTMLKSPAHQGVLDLINPDSSLSVDEPPAYGVVLLPPNGVVAHSQDVIADVATQRDPASG